MGIEFNFSLFVMIIVSFIISTLIIQWIWNSVMPSVFSLKEISFWQTIGLLILANVFFGINSKCVY